MQRGKTLAAKLAEAGMSTPEFASLLAKRSGGVWVYLRYVLQELRLGQRRPDAISDLPASSLWDYYAELIRGWQRTPSWDVALLPLVRMDALP